MEAVRRYVLDRATITACGHSSECWLWTRCRRDGYGRADIGGRLYQAHRIAYEAFKGEIPDGLQIDHLCCVTNCVNPAHLEAVTPQENLRRKAIRRGHVIGGRVRIERIKRARITKPKDRCKNGHEYTPETTRMVFNGKGLTVRACRICLRRNSSAYKKRRKELRAVRRMAEGGRSEQRGRPIIHDIAHRGEGPTR